MNRSPSLTKDVDEYQCQDLSIHSTNNHQQPSQQAPPGIVFPPSASVAGIQQSPASQQQQVANILALTKLIQSYRQRLQQQTAGGGDNNNGEQQQTSQPQQIDLAGLQNSNPQMMTNLLLNMYNNQQRLAAAAAAAGPISVGDQQQLIARFQQQVNNAGAQHAFQPAQQLHHNQQQQIQQQLLGQFARQLIVPNNNANLAQRPIFPTSASDPSSFNNNRASVLLTSPTPTSPAMLNNQQGRGGHRGGRSNNSHRRQSVSQQQQNQFHQEEESNNNANNGQIVDVDDDEQDTALDLQLMESGDSPKEHASGRKSGGNRQLLVKTHHPKTTHHHDSNKLLNASANAGRTMFTLLDLDLVLYGIIKPQVQEGNNTNNQAPSSNNLTGHAISCLSLGHLAYGIDKILSNSNGEATTPGASGNCGGHSGNNSGRHRANCPSTPDIMLLDLPEGFTINQSTLGGCVHYGVFSQREIVPSGTRFGPFQGRQVNPSEIKTNDDNTFMWEIFKDNKLSHFVDGRGSNGNWLAYVNSARFPAEQNLVALQENGLIFYEACRDIAAGSELLVWYGDEYAQSMGIPVGLKDEAAAMEVSAENEEDGSDNPEGFACERCGKVFAYKYYRDKHLKYTRCVDLGDRKFPCHLCNRSFEKRDRLRIHVLHVHEKHRPHKCSVCGKSFSQSSSLNKHMRVHSGERPYKCVYCSKAFTASSILRTHIRQHSGEKPFKCRHCGKSFASHAAHDSHVRRTHLRAANDNGMLVIGNETPTSVIQSAISSPAPSPQPSASLVIFPG